MISAGVMRQAFEIFIGAVNWLVSIIVWPISVLIKQFIPEVDTALGNISAWLLHATDYAGWVIDAFAIPKAVIVLVVAYFTYTLTSSFTAYAIKQALKWYKALRV